MLLANQFLPSGAYLVAQNQEFMGIVQNDGRFCVYRGNSIAKPGPIVRCAPAAPQPYAVYNMLMRDDGNLCISRGPVPALPAPGPQAQPAPVTCFPGTPRPRGPFFAVLLNTGVLELFPGRARGPAGTAPIWSMSAVPPLPAPPRMVPFTLGMVPPMPPKPAKAPVFGQPAPPMGLTFATLTAYPIDAAGKPDPRFPPITCGQQCASPQGMFPEGARILITSSLPLAHWVGACAAENKAPPDKAATRCELTLGATPLRVSGTLQ